MTDRTLLLAVSRDGGHNYGDWKFIPLGEVGEYRHRPRVRRLGMGRDWMAKIRVTSPLRVDIHGLVLDVEVGD
jgi:hypothetical protein